MLVVMRRAGARNLGSSATLEEGACRSSVFRYRRVLDVDDVLEEHGHVLSLRIALDGHGWSVLMVDHESVGSLVDPQEVRDTADARPPTSKDQSQPRPGKDGLAGRLGACG